MASQVVQRPREFVKSLQLECVSCNEHFTVPLDAPQPLRGATNITLGPALVCPRCSTNNLNWFNIKYAHLIIERETQSHFIRSLADQIIYWVERFHLAGLAVLITLVLTIWIPALAEDAQGTPLGSTTRIIFVISTFLAGTIPTLSITSQWKRIREWSFLNQVTKHNSLVELVPPYWIRAFLWVTVIAIIAPLAFYILFPKIDQLVTEVENAFAPDPSLLDQTNQMAQSVTTVTEKLLREEVNDMEKKMNLEIAARSLISITRQLQATVSTISEFQTVDGNPPEPPAETRMPLVRTWFKFVGGLSFVATILSLVSVSMYLQRINPLLPPPIFMSITKMSMLALRDLHNAPTIPPEELEKIIWLDTRRTARGGIVLHGSLELPAEAFGRPKRARTYLIETDPWVRMQDIQTKNGS